MKWIKCEDCVNFKEKKCWVGGTNGEPLFFEEVSPKYWFVIFPWWTWQMVCHNFGEKGR